MRVEKEGKEEMVYLEQFFDSATFSWRNCKSIQIRKMKRKNSCVMRRLDTTGKVALPNGRTFYAKYQRVPRSQLPPNVIMKRKYKRTAAPKGRRIRSVRKGQRGRGFLSSLKRIANNPTVR